MVRGIVPSLGVYRGVAGPTPQNLMHVWICVYARMYTYVGNIYSDIGARRFPYVVSVYVSTHYRAPYLAPYVLLAHHPQISVVGRTVKLRVDQAWGTHHSQNRSPWLRVYHHFF
jgi:hypothetical protein